MRAFNQLKNIFKFSGSNRVFLDFASGTKMSRNVLKVYRHAKVNFGANPSAIYKEGIVSALEIEKSRKNIASLFGAHPDGVFFTSGATESNNIVVQGVIKSFKKHNQDYAKVLVSPYEHKSVSEAVKIAGASIVEMPTEDNGEIDIKKTKEIINKENIILVCASFCSNETGMILPIKEIVKLVRHKRKESGSVFPIVHSDITHAILNTEIKLDTYGADILTFGGSKISGPKNIGAIITKLGIEIEPILGGGGQESGLRPGTLDVAGVNGLAKAVLEAKNNLGFLSDHNKELKDFLTAEIARQKLSVSIIEYKERIDSIIAIVVPKIESELLVIELDAKGLAVSSASACTKFSNTPVRAYEVSGIDLKNDGVIRISFGTETTKGDLKKLVKALSEIIFKYKDF